MGWRGRWEWGPRWRTHVNPWLIHVNVWQKSLQYCKVISLQLIKINEKNKKKESITTNKASGGLGVPVELFQTLKDDAVKVLHAIRRQIWKTQQWP